MPLMEPTRKTGAAAALVRAGLVDDQETGVLIIAQNGATQAELSALVVALAGLNVRTLLSANGGDVERAVRVIDQWIGRAARHELPEPA
jgi:hypothetical protein